MVDYIIPKKDVLDLYRKQKSEFNFHQRSDDEFIIFLFGWAGEKLESPGNQRLRGWRGRESPNGGQAFLLLGILHNGLTANNLFFYHT